MYKNAGKENGHTPGTQMGPNQLFGLGPESSQWSQPSIMSRGSESSRCDNKPDQFVLGRLIFLFIPDTKHFQMCIFVAKYISIERSGLDSSCIKGSTSSVCCSSQVGRGRVAPSITAYRHWHWVEKCWFLFCGSGQWSDNLRTCMTFVIQKKENRGGKKAVTVWKVVNKLWTMCDVWHDSKQP